MTKTIFYRSAWTAVAVVVIYAIFRLSDLPMWLTLAAGLAAVTILIALVRTALRFIRRKSLMTKYRDTSVVDQLMDRRFWQGQTAEQLLDAIGRPDDIDQKVLKTKKKEIWKYDHHGRNRYGLRITLDDDLVVGWEQKD